MSPPPGGRLGRWFRFYDDTVSESKVIKLSDANFRAWVNILCLASKEGGVIPPLDDIAIMLRLPEKEAGKRLSALVAAGLLDEAEGGFIPHNWGTRQYQSDGSTGRVQRFRERQRNGQ